jgi:hypothetical protein
MAIQRAAWQTQGAARCGDTDFANQVVGGADHFGSLGVSVVLSPSRVESFLDVDDQVGLGQLVAQARHLGLKVANLAFLSGGGVDLGAALVFELLGRGGRLTLLAQSGQMGRINAFPTQQGADVAKRLAGVGSGENALLFGV